MSGNLFAAVIVRVCVACLVSRLIPEKSVKSAVLFSQWTFCILFSALCVVLSCAWWEHCFGLLVPHWRCFVVRWLSVALSVCWAFLGVLLRMLFCCACGVVLCLVFCVLGEFVGERGRHFVALRKGTFILLYYNLTGKFLEGRTGLPSSFSWCS